MGQKTRGKGMEQARLLVAAALVWLVYSSPAAAEETKPAAQESPEKQMICPEDLAAEDADRPAGPETIKGPAQTSKAPVSPFADVWAPAQPGIGRGFSRYRGTGEFTSTGGGSASSSAPARRQPRISARSSSPQRPASSGSTIRFRRG